MLVLSLIIYVSKESSVVEVVVVVVVVVILLNVRRSRSADFLQVAPAGCIIWSGQP